MRDDVIKLLEKELKIKNLDSLLEVPKIRTQGDLSFPCFILSKELKKAPNELAQDLAQKLKPSKSISKIQAIGPYLNFFYNNNQVIEEIFKKIEKKQIFKVKSENPQKILIEYPSPNTNKALHIGHTRNMLLGNTLGNLLSKTGHKIIRINLNNDRGIAICKAMLSYKLFGKNQEPKDMNLEPDEFVSHWYVKFGEECKKNSNLDKEAQEMLLKWEEGDKETRALWKKLMKWVFQGYKETYKDYKVQKFDKEYFESEIYDKGKDIVLDALKNKVKGFGREEDGATFVDLEDKKLDKKYLLRGDGTTLYMTQDLYLAKLKQDEFKADKYIFIVGEEQQYHFKVLFEILDRLGFEGNKKNVHYSYGYVYDDKGKKFSSRLGNTVGARDILNQMIQKAKENLKDKELTKNLPEKELDRRAKVIGFGALSFVFLRANPQSTINFDINKALSFEGETGPYIQYTYARIKSILRKAEYKKSKINVEVFKEKEIELIKELGKYDEIVKEAEEKYKISHIALYLLNLAQMFNDFYQNISVLNAESAELKQSRLVLCDYTSQIIKEGLSILDIDVLEEM